MLRRRQCGCGAPAGRWALPVVAVAGAVALTSCIGGADRGGSADYVFQPTISEYEAPLLSDGVVTFAEYEEAVLATVACLRQSGVVASDPTLDQAGRIFVYSYEVSESESETLEDAQARADAVYSTCFTTYEDDLQNTWLRQTEPDSEERAALVAELLRCLEREGLSVPSDSSGDIRDLIESLGSTSLSDRQRSCVDVFVSATTTAG